MFFFSSDEWYSEIKRYWTCTKEVILFSSLQNFLFFAAMIFFRLLVKISTNSTRMWEFTHSRPRPPSRSSYFSPRPRVRRLHLWLYTPFYLSLSIYPSLFSSSPSLSSFFFDLYSSVCSRQELVHTATVIFTLTLLLPPSLRLLIFLYEKLFLDTFQFSYFFCFAFFGTPSEFQIVGFVFWTNYRFYETRASRTGSSRLSKYSIETSVV